MIFDAHAYLGTNPVWTKTGLPLPFDGGRWIEMMDRAGIQGVLVAPPSSGVAEDFKPDMKLIAKAIKEFSGRIFGFARIKPRRGQAALDELCRWVEECGFHAVKLNTRDDDYRLTDRKLLDPIVETAERLGIPVFFHTGDRHGATCTPGMAADIAVDFPNTTFIIGHMGEPGWYSELAPAMERAPNTVTETACVFRSWMIQDAVDRIGAERVLIGSNAPYSPIVFPPMLIREYMVRLSDSQREAILGGNLRRILKVNP